MAPHTNNPWVEEAKNKEEEDTHKQGQGQDMIKTTEEDIMVVGEDRIMAVKEAQTIRVWTINTARQKME